MLTHLSLFSGIGGLDLAAEWAGIKTVGQCEFADYPTRVLERHWPDVPRWRDVRTLTGGDFYAKTGRRTVGIISGGFPCQPFSTAGKRRGKEDDRYLWPEMLRIVSELRPAWVVGENVAGIINMALDTAISDLEAQGYAVQAIVLPACAVGAPHQRNRVAIIAHSHDDACNVAHTQCVRWGTEGRQSGYDQKRNGKAQEPAGWTELCETGSGGKPFCDTASQGFPDGAGRPVERQTEEPEFKRPDSHVSNAYGQGWQRGRFTRETRRSHPPGDNWWDIEPNVGRVAHGIPARVDRHKCLGNAVVPQQFYPIFKTIADIERGNQN